MKFQILFTTTAASLASTGSALKQKAKSQSQAKAKAKAQVQVQQQQQSTMQMGAGVESLTDYDRATVGLDELMGDLSGQITELRGFPSSVFFQEAVNAGLGQHIDAVNPWTQDHQPTPTQALRNNAKQIEKWSAHKNEADVLTLHNAPLPNPAMQPQQQEHNVTKEIPPMPTLRSSAEDESKQLQAKYDFVMDKIRDEKPVVVSFQLPQWLASPVKSEANNYLVRGVAMLTLLVTAIAYVIHKNKVALKMSN